MLQCPKYTLPESCGRCEQCELNQKSEKKDFQSFKRTPAVLHVGQYRIIIILHHIEKKMASF